jgi:hypothetical protein
MKISSSDALVLTPHSFLYPEDGDRIRNYLFLNGKFLIIKVKVQQSHYRPGQSQRVPGS